MARPINTTVTRFSAKRLDKTLNALNSLIARYATTSPASRGLLDMARKHIAAFVERESLDEPPFQPDAAHRVWEVEAGRLDDLEIGAMQAMLAFPTAADGDIFFKFEYVRALREYTGDDAFAYGGAFEALSDALLAGRMNGTIAAGSSSETEARVWIGALVYLESGDDKDDPISLGGDHVIEGIEGAGIRVDGSARWYPVSRVSSVLPDFSIGVDDRPHEYDDLTLLRLHSRMKEHLRRAKEVEPESNRTHELWEQGCREAGVWHDIEAYQRQTPAERVEYEKRRPAMDKMADQIAKKVGHDDARRAWEHECTQAFLLQRAIRSIPAYTLAGLKAKADATVYWHYDGDLPDADEATDHHDASLIALLGNIGDLAEAPQSTFKGPALPDLSALSDDSLWESYKVLTTMRDRLVPLEEADDRAVKAYAEAWADAIFAAYADIGEYAMRCGRKGLGLLRAQFAIDFAEGQDVQVIGRDVPSYARPAPASEVAKAA